MLAGGVFFCGTCAAQPAVQAAAAAAAREAAAAAAAAAATAATAAPPKHKRLVLSLGARKDAEAESSKRLKLVLPKAPGSSAPSSSWPPPPPPPSALALRAKTMLRFPVRGNKGEVEGVRREAWGAGFPLLEEYDYQRDSRNQVLRTQCRSVD